MATVTQLKAKDPRRKAAERARQEAAKEKALKQNSYNWEGKNKSGQKVKGDMLGTSEAMVKAILRKQGVNPTKVKKKSKPLLGGDSSKKITTGDITIFARQLTTMMSSGVPLVQAFEIVGKGHENPAMRNLLGEIRGDIEAGGTLADALRKHPAHFDALFCNLVEAGEQGGILEDLLGRIALYKEKTEAIKKKVKGALTYPIAVLVIAFIITAILMIFVIPVFADMFADVGAELPAFTAFVVSLSNSFIEYWYLIFGSIGLAVYGFIEGRKRSQTFDHAVQRFMLKIPLIGEITRKSSIARFARTMSTMFAAGTPLVEAMESVAGATGNIVYVEATLKMRDEIATGVQLNTAMQETGVFPNMVVQMCQIGEEAGSLDMMMSKVADFYEEEVDNLVDAMSSLMEPMIMAFLGVVIGGLVLAMYLPIFKMGQAF